MMKRKWREKFKGKKSEKNKLFLYILLNLFYLFIFRYI